MPKDQTLEALLTIIQITRTDPSPLGPDEINKYKINACLCALRPDFTHLDEKDKSYIKSFLNDFEKEFIKGNFQRAFFSTEHIEIIAKAALEIDKDTSGIKKQSIQILLIIAAKEKRNEIINRLVALSHKESNPRECLILVYKLIGSIIQLTFLKQFNDIEQYFVSILPSIKGHINSLVSEEDLSALIKQKKGQSPAEILEAMPDIGSAIFHMKGSGKEFLHFANARNSLLIDAFCVLIKEASDDQDILSKLEKVNLIDCEERKAKELLKKVCDAIFSQALELNFNGNKVVVARRALIIIYQASVDITKEITSYVKSQFPDNNPDRISKIKAAFIAIEENSLLVDIGISIAIREIEKNALPKSAPSKKSSNQRKQDNPEPLEDLDALAAALEEEFKDTSEPTKAKNKKPKKPKKSTDSKDKTDPAKTTVAETPKTSQTLPEEVPEAVPEKVPEKPIEHQAGKSKKSKKSKNSDKKPQDKNFVPINPDPQIGPEVLGDPIQSAEEIFVQRVLANQIEERNWLQKSFDELQRELESDLPAVERAILENAKKQLQDKLGKLKIGKKSKVAANFFKTFEHEQSSWLEKIAAQTQDLRIIMTQLEPQEVMVAGSQVYCSLLAVLDSGLEKKFPISRKPKDIDLSFVIDCNKAGLVSFDSVVDFISRTLAEKYDFDAKKIHIHPPETIPKKSINFKVRDRKTGQVFDVSFYHQDQQRHNKEWQFAFDRLRVNFVKDQPYLAIKNLEETNFAEPIDFIFAIICNPEQFYQANIEARRFLQRLLSGCCLVIPEEFIQAISAQTIKSDLMREFEIYKKAVPGAGAQNFKEYFEKKYSQNPLYKTLDLDSKLQDLLETEATLLNNSAPVVDEQIRILRRGQNISDVPGSSIRVRFDTKALLKETKTEQESL